MTTKDSYFVPENACVDRRMEHVSPSGKYRLVVTPFVTRKGSWDLTQGLVFRAGQHDPIAEVRRNYSSFEFEWVENHPNGHAYLVCGEDYQGQTVIELDTAQRRDYLPPEASKGHGFCWVKFNYNRENQLIVACGCIWACPYEYRFYDFSDPMNGWPQVGVDFYFDAEGKEPTIEDDGTITTYETREKGRIEGADDYDEDYDDTLVVVATRTVKRDGLNFVEVSSWIDEAEVVRRAESKARQEEWDRQWKEYKATNALFLRVQERADIAPFCTKEYSLSTGVCYDGWHPTQKFDDARVCRRMLEKPRDENGRQSSKGWTVDLEWGRVHAPVRLSMYKDGKNYDIDTRSMTDKSSAKFFEHSVQGIDEALDLAASIINSDTDSKA